MYQDKKEQREFDQTLATRSSYTLSMTFAFLTVRMKVNEECAKHSGTEPLLPGFKKPMVAHQGLPGVLM